MSDHQDLPPITLDEIRAWTDEASFGRGESYFRQGHILSPRRQERTLIAECLGSRPSPYRIEMTLGESGIAAGSCSCPVGLGGHCKHAVALLLTWLHTPEDFNEVESLTSALDALTREELVALIQNMIMRHPDIESMLTLKTLSSPARTQALDQETIRRQVTSALFSHGHDWQSGHHISAELSGIVALADRFAERMEWPNAALVYRTVAETIRADYDEIFDHEGDVIAVVADCVAGLGNCLTAAPDLASRPEILRTLFDLYRWDVSLGGYGAADEVPALLLEFARPDERRTLTSWIREALPPSAGEDTFARGWQRQTLGGFLLALEADQLDDEQYLELCRETGRYLELMDRLLELGRIDEAVAGAARSSGYQLSSVADLFVAHGHGNLAQTLVTERWEQSEDRWSLSWLKQYAEHHGQPERALEIAQLQFRQEPGPAGYGELRRLAEPLDRWPAVRAEVLSRLAAEDHYADLVRIHLQEGSAEAALQAFEKLEEQEAERRRQTPFSGWRAAHGLHLPVAAAIAASHPWKAVALIRQVVDRLIAARGRGSYAQAAQHLQTMRDIYAANGALEGWQAFIEELKDQNRRLRALHDELRQAGL